MKKYKNTANELGIKYHFWKYGLQIRGWRISIIPLDGWLFGEEMEKEMKKRNYEL